MKRDLSFFFLTCKHTETHQAVLTTKQTLLEKQPSFPYLPVDFPCCTAFSNKCLYSGILEAASKREGLVVASVGLYCSITEMRTSTRRNDQDKECNKDADEANRLPLKSPESATTVVYFFSWSSAPAISSVCLLQVNCDYAKSRFRTRDYNIVDSTADMSIVPYMPHASFVYFHSWPAASFLTTRNKMADGGDLTIAAAAGDWKVWIPQGSSFFYAYKCS